MNHHGRRRGNHDAVRRMDDDKAAAKHGLIKDVVEGVEDDAVDHDALGAEGQGPDVQAHGRVNDHKAVRRPLVEHAVEGVDKGIAEAQRDKAVRRGLHHETDARRGRAAVGGVARLRGRSERCESREGEDEGALQGARECSGGDGNGSFHGGVAVEMLCCVVWRGVWCAWCGVMMRALRCAWRASGWQTRISCEGFRVAMPDVVVW